jgi:hypothetical protein
MVQTSKCRISEPLGAVGLNNIAEGDCAILTFAFWFLIFFGVSSAGLITSVHEDG